jgi:hypothetical protein
MSYIQRQTVVVTTASDGSATVYSDTVTGKLSQIRYEKNNFANGVDFAITAEATGETLWSESDVNTSATVAPRQVTHNIAGGAALYAGSGTAVLDKIALANDRVKIVIGSGGDTTSGKFHFIFE